MQSISRVGAYEAVNEPGCFTDVPALVDILLKPVSSLLKPCINLDDLCEPGMCQAQRCIPQLVNAGVDAVDIDSRWLKGCSGTPENLDRPAALIASPEAPLPTDLMT